MNISEKIEFINQNIEFWEAELINSNAAQSFLEELGDQLKINMNIQYVHDIELRLNILNNEKEALTNQA
jgi:hypothetical protein